MASREGVKWIEVEFGPLAKLSSSHSLTLKDEYLSDFLKAKRI